jgi:hypothetical protein
MLAFFPVTIFLAFIKELPIKHFLSVHGFFAIGNVVFFRKCRGRRILIFSAVDKKMENCLDFFYIQYLSLFNLASKFEYGNVHNTRFTFSKKVRERFFRFFGYDFSLAFF